MEYKNFLEFLMRYRKINDNLSELYNIGFDLLEGKYHISEDVYFLLKSFLESHYTKEGIEWIEWFIFESEYGTKKDITAKDENGELLCHSFESLWVYTKKYLKNEK
jgi:hypothetical protein